ncbi:MAG: PrsW family intramembrane metalloprotease, partial [Acidobacteria bacterium]|nr:PrsW family intramembrane metalloprotease [Acidobacteriota bacterium]
MAAEQWFYGKGRETLGPVDRATLIALFAEGTISRSTLVWKDGMAAWIAVGKVEGLLPSAAPPPQPPRPPALPDPPPKPVLKADPRAERVDARPATDIRGDDAHLRNSQATEKLPGAMKLAEEGARRAAEARVEPAQAPAAPPPPPVSAARGARQAPRAHEEPAAPPPPVVVAAPARALEPSPPSPMAVAAAAAAAVPKEKDRGVLGGIGAKLSEVGDLPTLSGLNVKDFLLEGLKKDTRAEDIEEVFIAGTTTTTPQLADVVTGWPVPRVFWRILGGALLTYFLLYIGLTSFNNLNFLPGLIVVGSFVVPMAVVVLFFELNIPRNVSVYQVGKMLLLGGAWSLVVTVFLFTVIPGSGTGAIIPAMLTGVTEETGKALALLLVASSSRWRWQLNGLLFGAAVGAGFAGFESAGYAFKHILGPLSDITASITLRGLLAPGGHVIWTAMVGSAIWKVKGDSKFDLKMLTHP